jgi:tol-pal system protein YbgF
MTRFGVVGLAFCMAFGAAGMAPAQSREATLADIRQQLSVLYVDVQRLKRELSTTGGVQGGTGGGSALQRIDGIEQQLQRLTARSEELEFRINQIVADGTNRIGDLEFRLCELEADCDISKLGETTTLGGEAAAPAPIAPVAVPPAGGTELAIGEQADFDRAKAALDAADFEGAASQFAAFTQTYPAGPLSGEAHFYRGEALHELGRTTESARAFLESFSGAPDGPLAPEALYRLGLALNDLGQKSEACVTLGQVPVRFPAAAVAADANAAIESFGCN